MSNLFKFLPSLYKGKEESPLFMFSFMLLVCFFILLCYSISLLLNAETSVMVNVSNFVNTCILVLCFWFTRSEKGMYRSVRIILTFALVFHYCNLWFTGGIYSYGFIWTILIVIGAYFFSGVRLGMVFTVLVLIGVSFYYTVEKMGLWTLQKPILQIDPEVVTTIRISVVLVLSIMLYTFVKSKDALQKKNNELTESAMERLSEQLDIKGKELASLRDKIAKDFHDEMGNKLASINILSQTIGLQIEQGKNVEEIRHTLEAIELRSKELYLGTKHFIWAIDVKSDLVFELFVCIREFSEQFFNELNIDFESESVYYSDSNHKMYAASSRQVVLACKEIMTNAAKHSKCNGVKLYFKASENHLVIEIKDDGIGFDTSLVEKRGLLNIKKRLEDVKAHYVVDSNSEGTNYQLFIPLVQ